MSRIYPSASVRDSELTIKINHLTVNIGEDERHHEHHHDPITHQYHAVPRYRLAQGVNPMSAAFNLPFDEIATVNIFAVRKSGKLSGVIPGSTVTSDSIAVVVALAADGSYTATAATNVVGTTANISLSPPSGDATPVDVAVVTITAALLDPIVSQTQDTANLVLTPNPTPPTA